MISAFSELTRLPLECAHKSFPIRDIAFDPERRQMHSALIEAGGFLTPSEAIILAHRLGQVAPKGDRWITDLSEDDIASAPRISQRHTAPDGAHWAPAIVGPVGITPAPVLLAEKTSGDHETDADDLPEGLQRWSKWNGAPVFGPAGEIGHLVDLHVDLDTARLVEATLVSGNDRFTLPMGALRNLVLRAPHVVTDLTQADLAAGMTAATPGPDLPISEGQG